MTSGQQLALIEADAAPVLSIEEGRKRRDAGTSRVLENSGEWKDRVAVLIGRFAALGDEFDTDDLRDSASLSGISEPPHPNAWGAAVVSASRRGVVEWTGEVVQSTRPEAHARLIRVWRGTSRAVHPSGRGA